MKEVVEETCREITDLDVCDEESVQDKVMKLGLVVQFKYEIDMSEWQVNLYPTMPQDVRDQRED